ncbi:MAG TPA: hydrogenase formation protein HypD [Candidatus Sumerlaeota bacterium]|nr:hydrogenase formation protein HypD [Candidatus Sumerlaeota bacterium]
MKYVDEYRDGAMAARLVEKVRELVGRQGRIPTFMEVCGTHTMSISRSGLRRQLRDRVTLLSGPGCPVCVTPNDFLDRAVALARRPDVIIATFGDMMKVPGSTSSLEREKSEGARIRIVYSPLDSLKTARENPDKKVVFLGIGFETTAPTVAATMLKARTDGLKNFFILCGHKRVAPALKALVTDSELHLDGFLLPGHVSAVIGEHPYKFIAHDYRTPCVIAGFEPLDILEALRMLLIQMDEGAARVDNEYTRLVRPEGNPRAREMMDAVFTPMDSAWRGIGMIPDSGLGIKDDYSDMDALICIPVEVEETREHPECRCGAVLRGIASPPDCPLFRVVCQPHHPVGPCMVSTEGTCAAWYRYED